MTTKEFYKQAKELYNTLPEPLQKAFDLVAKATKNGTDFDSYKTSETKNRVINLAVSKFEDYVKKSNHNEWDDIDKSRIDYDAIQKGKAKPTEFIKKINNVHLNMVLINYLFT